MQQKLYLFVGYPGAGKTTVARRIAERTGAEHIWADQERHRMFTEPVHSQDESQQLYAYLNDKTDRLLAAGKSVIFDTNFNFKKDRQYLRSIADKYGARMVIIWVATPRDLAEQRAVRESHGQDIRFWGNMPARDFERVANNLEPPEEPEFFIKIDGTKLADADVERILAA